MASLEEIARTALDGDPLILRSLVQDWLAAGLPLGDVPCPATRDPAVLAVSAALAERLAQRTGPRAAAGPRVLVRAATRCAALRAVEMTGSPKFPHKPSCLFRVLDFDATD